ncbi:gp091 [Rhodococcus phage ReqiPoco6]|uniref:Gp091 n=1 Tax=Rhodococcus phage ReqiPoco6 TaxID=691964 RepID=D4P7V9_9CAUD|nr:gp091 [Rhodococcus phage ReqiPoco6]ADD81089.1 gp091 [Rhodococcus phage ReqiPoco6]
MKLKVNTLVATAPTPKIFFCPRCDRPFPQGTKSLQTLSSDLLKHVHEAHPDYDSEWYDTYPEEAHPLPEAV